MAERRMFNKKITESDAFLDMPPSTQALYFHLSMNADDDGFINNPKSIQRIVGASDDDLRLLLAKKFIIAFDTGVIVIKHWKMHNYIQSDRYKPTDYIDEKSCLELDEKKAYRLNVSNLDTDCIQNGYIGKDRLGKDRLGDKYIVEQTSTPYAEIIDYLNARTGQSYRATTKNTQTLIKARMKEGFTVDDFKTVIDNMANKWMGDAKMQQYLRPQTLFGTKFESYLNVVETQGGTANAFAMYAMSLEGDL